MFGFGTKGQHEIEEAKARVEAARVRNERTVMPSLEDEALACLYDAEAELSMTEAQYAKRSDKAVHLARADVHDLNSQFWRASKNERNEIRARIYEAEASVSMTKAKYAKRKRVKAIHEAQAQISEAEANQQRSSDDEKDEARAQVYDANVTLSMTEAKYAKSKEDKLVSEAYAEIQGAWAQRLRAKTDDEKRVARVRFDKAEAELDLARHP